METAKAQDVSEMSAEEEPLPPSPKIDLLGLEVDALDQEGVVRRIGELCRSNGRIHTLLYLNAHTYFQQRDNPHVRKLEADVVYPDGMSIVWASKLLGRPLPEKLTLSDLVHPIARYAAEQDMGIYLLGGKPSMDGRPSVAERAAAALRRGCPDLKVVGTHHGYFRPEENDRIVAAINRARPHILFVGMGAPQQETWISQNLDRLQVPVCIPSGGLFDFLSGEIPRAPRWMSDHGLEWFFRLLVEPGRLWKRYSYENARFAWSLGRELLRRGRTRRSS